MTHAGDFDQRYVALTFTHVAGTANLQVTLANDPSVLPPGYYMLWIIDNAELPCELARFVRIAQLSCEVITDRSTFSEEEVLSYEPNDAVIPFAVFAVYDGFLPGELTGTPTLAVSWEDTGDTVLESDIALLPSESRWLEYPPEWVEVAQKITYPYTVELRNPGVFSTFIDRRSIRVTFTLAGQSCTGILDLIKSPNPYMEDIDPVAQNPYYLSTDIRTFRVRAGQPMFGDITHGSGTDAPQVFLRAVIDRFRGLPNNGVHPFRGLAVEGDSAAVDLAPMEGSTRVYNYAIAKVRYRATITDAERVKVFFRLCTTAATGLEYNSSTVYNNSGPGLTTVPLLGPVGGEIASIPFFLSPRVETRSGRPDSASMTVQSLENNYEIQTIVPTSGAEVTAYFGCWLDINEPSVQRFPLMPGGDIDGPWDEGVCQPVQEFFRSPHQCLVAEVYFEGDPTGTNDTPGSSDNLSQRNLVFLHSDNPGAPGSHHVFHPFEVKPSSGFHMPKGSKALAPGGSSSAALKQVANFGPDELLIRWHNLPRDSEVTLFFSDVDTADILRIAAEFRRSPAAFEVIDKDTVRFRVADGTWMPLPGGRILNIPALLSVKLPDAIVSGQEFRISIHQVDGATRRVTGAFQINIPVTKAELILDREIRNLSLMKHIATTIPSTNRWYPIFLRYLHGLSLRVNALGGDSKNVHGNPDGSGHPYLPPARVPVVKACHEGWMTSLVLALTILLVGLSPSRTIAAVVGVVGIILLAAIIGWWTRRCCGRIRCALIEYLTLGGGGGARGASSPCTGGHDRSVAAIDDCDGCAVGRIVGTCGFRIWLPQPLL